MVAGCWLLLFGQNDVFIPFCSEYYKEYSTAARPDLAYRAKLPHILPQGGVAGETEYEHRWTQ